MHGEYVKDRRSTLALRMVGYRAQIRRRHPSERIVQFVLVLDDGIGVPDRYDDPDGCMWVRWSVVRASDLDREVLLTRPTTAALAALAGGSAADRAHALTAAADLIAQVEPGRRRRLLDAAATLASIHLPLPIIETALLEASMPVPIRDLPLARALLNEGRVEGRVELTAAVLRRRFGDDPRVASAAAALAALPGEEALDRVAGARRLEDLLP